jgi:hypothetical protein
LNQGEFFDVVASVSVISSSIQTTLVVAQFFYHASLPSYRNHLHRESHPGQFFGVVAFVSAISLKHATLVLAPFFYRA